MAIPHIDETRRQNEILATTLPDITPEIVNNSVDAHPGLSLFAGSLGEVMFGRVDGAGRGKRYASGESIETRARLDKNSTSRWLNSGYSAFDQDTQDTSRVLRSNWKFGGSTIVIDGMSRRNNSGAARIASLLGEKTSDAVGSLVDFVAASLFSGSASNEITGLDTLISANSAVQGASGASFPRWNSRGVTRKGTAAGSISFGSASFASQGISDMRLAWLMSEEGIKKPHALICDDLVYTYYEGALVPEVRFASTKSGDKGFENLLFKTAPIFHDPYATAGSMYFLNFDHIELVCARGADFDVTPMNDQAFQDAFSAKVLFQGNLVTNARFLLNKLTGMTA